MLSNSSLFCPRDLCFSPPNVPLVLDPPPLGLGPVRRRLLLVPLRVHVTGLQEARQDDQGAQVGRFSSTTEIQNMPH